jgi:glycosyltransferase involved in cell wall biosynthesis
MKITFIQPRYDPRPVGGMKVLYEYANQLAARGHEVTVVHPHRLRNISLNPVTKFRLWLTEQMKQVDSPIIPDDIHWHSIDSRVNMLYVPEPTAQYIPDGDAVIASFYLTLEYINDYPEAKGEKFYLVQGFEGWAGPVARELAALRAPVKKIVISKALYEHAVELGISADDIFYIPDGIDHSKFRIIYPIEDRRPRIAMLYHIIPIKGAKEGIHAIELIRRHMPSIPVVLFGIFPRPKTLPSWIEYYQDPPQEELIGSIYSMSSIFISASWTEGFGLPIAEAMACGCAVVSTDSGGVRDIAKHMVTAMLSPPKVPEALAQNALRLLEDDDLRIRLAKAGNERVQEFTWQRSTALLEQLIANSKSSPNGNPI